MQDTASYPIIDGHVDILYEMMSHHETGHFHERSVGAVTLDKLKEGNVRVIVAALYCPDAHNGPVSASAFLDGLLDFADTRLTGLKPIRTMEDLDGCYARSSDFGALFLLENADALMDGGLDRLERRAVKVVGLTHMGSNRIGDGNRVSYPEGLRSGGKDLVRELRRRGCALDAAHLSDPCFRDVVKIFEGPMISSHTGFRFFCDTPRNLTQEQLAVLFERQGIVGISASPTMISSDGQGGRDEFFKHIDWVTQKYGPEYVALGSDFCGFQKSNRDMEDISALSTLVDVFHGHGYPSDAIGKIMGGNWNRLYSSLLGT